MRPALLLPAVAVLVLATAAPAQSEQRKLLETYTLKYGDSVVTKTSFKMGGDHVAKVSGTLSYRYHVGNDPTVYGFDSDAFWTYTCIGCGEPRPPNYSGHLQVRGEGGWSEFGGGLHNYSETGSAPKYNPAHTYELSIDHAVGPLTLSVPEPQAAYSKTGAVTIQIYDECGKACALPVDVDWQMKPRYGERRSDGVVDARTSAEEIDPRRGFEVDVNFKRKGGCTGTENYKVEIDGKLERLTEREKKHCELALRLKEGKHELTVEGKAGKRLLEGTETITVQDWLIVGLGDSIGSGEGNPDLPITDDRSRPVWQAPRCHRSANSYQARAAERLEQHDKLTSVTFLHLACSGAAIAEGVLGEYGGIVRQGALAPLTAQIAEVKDLIGDREVDAVILSIGANDMRFGDILSFCVKHGTCQDTEYADGLTLRNWMFQRFAGGFPDYGGLRRALLDAVIRPARVYIVEYPDPLREENGTAFCDSVINLLGLRAIRADEAQWTFENFLLPLNGRIQETSQKFSWTVVQGAQQAFAPHGYCADDRSRWMVQLTESRARQGDANGTMHPNRRGHLELMKLVRKELYIDLYPSGKARAPGQ